MPTKSEATGATEGCPPPLDWQEVVGSFRRDAEVWYLDRPKYRLTGRLWGRGRPLYILPGIGGSAELFALLVWLLRDEFRCVVWDYPGTASARDLPPKLTLDDLAADVPAIADVCGDSSMDILAASFGGLIAMRGMQLYPERIRRVILQGGFAHRRLSVAERFLVRICRWLPFRLRYVPLRTAVERQNHRAWFPPFDATRWQFFVENAGNVPIAALAARGRIIRDTDLGPTLSGLSQPVLLLAGEGEGGVADACRRDLALSLPNARVEELHNTGHLPYLTHPHRVAKLLREFLLADEEPRIEDFRSPNR